MNSMEQANSKPKSAGWVALGRWNSATCCNGSAATAGRSNGLNERMRLVAVVTIILIVGAAGADETNGSRQIGRKRFLVLDSRIIDSTENARLTLGQVQKHPANPLFGEDKPLEARFDNLYANVIYDEEEQTYKCWYSPFIVDHSAKGMTPEQRNKPYSPPRNREQNVCYATSKDGLKWDKPELG